MCELGRHWIHYRCDKLSQDEINRLHNDKGLVYSCKECQRQNTVVKTVNCVTQPEKSLTLKIPTLSPRATDTAVEILNEETVILCNVCLCDLLDNKSICDRCGNACHADCMDQNMNENCLSCMASTANLSILASTNNNGATLQSTTESNSLLQASNEKSKPKSDTATEKTKSKSDIAAVDIKYKDLRQLETRLKKWEDNLKLRESQISNVEVEFKRLEGFLEKTESRNQELEQTVKTLQRKIVLLESNINNKGDNVLNVSPNDRKSDDSDELIQGLRTQVTKFILNKVAQQISVLEQLDNSQFPVNKPQDCVYVKDENLVSSGIQSSYSSNPYVLEQNKLTRTLSDENSKQPLKTMVKSDAPMNKNKDICYQSQAIQSRKYTPKTTFKKASSDLTLKSSQNSDTIFINPSVPPVIGRNSSPIRNNDTADMVSYVTGQPLYINPPVERHEPSRDHFLSKRRLKKNQM